MKEYLEQLEANNARKDKLIEELHLDAEVLCNSLDEVRCMYCDLLASHAVTMGVMQSAEQIAKSLGWRCYERGCQ